MLTLAQIQAESSATGLGPEEMVAIKNLVKQSQIYRTSGTQFVDFFTILDVEQTTPTVITQILRAVLTALGRLPTIEVESEGTDKSKSFFSSRANWEALAYDVLGAFYDEKFLIARPTMSHVTKITYLDLNNKRLTI